jgi:hypothetical protein
MVDREALRGVLGMGGLLGMGGMILLLLQPAGSAEQILSGCSAMMGFTLIGMVILVTRLRGRERE